MDDIKRILVLSRSTEDCRKALHYGISLAQKYGAELFVLHVIHDPFSAEGWSLPIPDLGALQEEQQKMRVDIKKELDKIIASEKTQGMAIKEFVKEGVPVDEVIKIVEKEKIDLIIIPAHEEGRLEHLLFSRDNEKLMRKMPCSILLVKHELF
jgi:nucleotide-binding universal stress UspA family protein